MEKKHNLVYKTIRIKTNEYYIGVHSTNDINDSYLGSGDRIKNLIKKYGKKEFIREILYYCKTRNSALKLESKLVTKKTIDDPLCLNITIGGKGNSDENIRQSEESNRKRSNTLKKGKYHSWMRGKKHPESTKQKMVTITLSIPSRK